MEGFILLVLIIVVVCIVVKDNNGETQSTNTLSSNMICPHCHTKGSVTTQRLKQKVGISGGKATAGILTCGISLLGTGLSRKQWVTEAHCSNCGNVWRF